MGSLSQKSVMRPEQYGDSVRYYELLTLGENSRAKCPEKVWEESPPLFSRDFS